MAASLTIARTSLEARHPFLPRFTFPAYSQLLRVYDFHAAAPLNVIWYSFVTVMGQCFRNVHDRIATHIADLIAEKHGVARQLRDYNGMNHLLPQCFT